MKADRGGAATAADADGGGDDDSGPVKYFQFQFEPGHIEKGKRGQKVFVCDICHGIFKRSFSLKRHYLRFHINFALVSPRDLNNCAIVASNHRSIVPPSAGPVKKASLLYRCHQCGYLMASKADLLLHLQTHPPAPTETSPAPRAASASAGQAVKAEAVESAKAAATENATVAGETTEVDRYVNGVNRCSRCSTAFSLRKTLQRHIKKNRCRNANAPSASVAASSSSAAAAAAAAAVAKATATAEALARSVAQEAASDAADAADSEEMDMETLLKLGCSTSLFHFACTACARLFRTYASVCQHRRLVHGSGPRTISSPRLHPTDHKTKTLTTFYRTMTPAKNLFGGVDHSVAEGLRTYVKIVDDNLRHFLDAKWPHIQRQSAPLTEEKTELTEADAEDRAVLERRWSWTPTNYDVRELMRLDVPLQQALFKGLASWRADTEEAAGTSQPDSLTSALQLRAVVAEQPPAPLPLPLPPTTSTSTTTRPNRPPVVEFSGEWSRLKVYLCAPCGRIFDDFYQLHDHQTESHASVLYRHVEVDETWRAALDQLRSQVVRYAQRQRPAASPRSAASASAATVCTKCHATLGSLAELHSHIIDCSDHATAGPSRKRRSRALSNSRRSSQWQSTAGGRSRGMQRSACNASNPSTSASKSARSLRTRSPKEDSRSDGRPGDSARRKGARRILNFGEAERGGGGRTSSRTGSGGSKAAAALAGRRHSAKVVKGSLQRVLRQRPSVAGATTPDALAEAKLKNKNKKKKKKKKKKEPSVEEDAAAAALAVPSALEKTRSSKKPLLLTKENQLPQCSWCFKLFQTNSSLKKHRRICRQRPTDEPMVVAGDAATQGAPAAPPPAKKQQQRATDSAKPRANQHKQTVPTIKQEIQSKTKVVKERAPSLPVQEEAAAAKKKKSKKKKKQKEKEQEAPRVKADPCSKRQATDDESLNGRSRMEQRKEKDREMSPVGAKAARKRPAESTANDRLRSKSAAGAAERPTPPAPKVAKLPTTPTVAKSTTTLKPTPATGSDAATLRSDSIDDEPQEALAKSHEATEEVMASARPVRSSRRVAASLSFASDPLANTDAERSFLEALLPEQRLKVANQTCPFCSRRYVYRNNFQKHLREGCDSTDADEEPKAPATPKTPLPPKDADSAKRKNSSATGVEKKTPKRRASLPKPPADIETRPKSATTVKIEDDISMERPTSPGDLCNGTDSTTSSLETAQSTAASEERERLASENSTTESTSSPPAATSTDEEGKWTAAAICQNEEVDSLKRPSSAAAACEILEKEAPSQEAHLTSDTTCESEGMDSVALPSSPVGALQDEEAPSQPMEGTTSNSLERPSRLAAATCEIDRMEEMDLVSSVAASRNEETDSLALPSSPVGARQDQMTPSQARQGTTSDPLKLPSLPTETCSETEETAAPSQAAGPPSSDVISQNGGTDSAVPPSSSVDACHDPHGTSQTMEGTTSGSAEPSSPTPAAFETQEVGAPLQAADLTSSNVTDTNGDSSTPPSSPVAARPDEQAPSQILEYPSPSAKTCKVVGMETSSLVAGPASSNTTSNNGEQGSSPVEARRNEQAPPEAMEGIVSDRPSLPAMDCGDERCETLPSMTSSAVGGTDYKNREPSQTATNDLLSADGGALNTRPLVNGAKLLADLRVVPYVNGVCGSKGDVVNGRIESCDSQTTADDVETVALRQANAKNHQPSREMDETRVSVCVKTDPISPETTKIIRIIHQVKKDEEKVELVCQSQEVTRRPVGETVDHVAEPLDVNPVLMETSKTVDRVVDQVNDVEEKVQSNCEDPAAGDCQPAKNPELKEVLTRNVVETVGQLPEFEETTHFNCNSQAEPRSSSRNAVDHMDVDTFSVEASKKVDQVAHQASNEEKNLKQVQTCQPTPKKPQDSAKQIRDDSTLEEIARSSHEEEAKNRQPFAEAADHVVQNRRLDAKSDLMDTVKLEGASVQPMKEDSIQKETRPPEAMDINPGSTETSKKPVGQVQSDFPVQPAAMDGAIPQVKKDPILEKVDEVAQHAVEDDKLSKTVEEAVEAVKPLQEGVDCLVQHVRVDPELKRVEDVVLDSVSLSSKEMKAPTLAPANMATMCSKIAANICHYPTQS